MTVVTCAVTKGDLPLKIVWTLNNQTIRDIAGVTVESKKRVSQLSIDSVHAEHAGEYVCTATNRAGSSSYSAVLNVNGIFFYLCLVISSFLFSFFPIPIKP